MPVLLGAGKKPGKWPASFGLVGSEHRDLWRGLKALIPLNEGSGAPLDVGRKFAPQTASGSWTSTDLGWGYALNAGSSEFLDWTEQGLNFSGDVELGFLVVVDVTGWVGSFPGIFAHRSTNTTGAWVILRLVSGNRLRFEFRDAGGTAQTVDWAGALISDLVRRTIIITRRKGGVFEAWVDGISQGTRTNVTDLAAADHELVLGTLEQGHTANATAGVYHIAAVWEGRSFSEADAQLLSADPFGLIRPNWDYLTAAAGGESHERTVQSTGTSALVDA